MIYNNEKEYLNNFIKELKDDCTLKQNAIRAANYANISKEDYDDYIVIKVEGYYNIVKVTDEWEPIEISNIVYPFDEKRIYPTQQIEQIIRYKHGY